MLPADHCRPVRPCNSPSGSGCSAELPTVPRIPIFQLSTSPGSVRPLGIYMQAAKRALSIGSLTSQLAEPPGAMEPKMAAPPPVGWLRAPGKEIESDRTCGTRVDRHAVPRAISDVLSCPGHLLVGVQPQELSNRALLVRCHDHHVDVEAESSCRKSDYLRSPSTSHRASVETGMSFRATFPHSHGRCLHRVRPADLRPPLQPP